MSSEELEQAVQHVLIPPLAALVRGYACARWRPVKYRVVSPHCSLEGWCSLQKKWILHTPKFTFVDSELDARLVRPEEDVNEALENKRKSITTVSFDKVCVKSLTQRFTCELTNTSIEIRRGDEVETCKTFYGGVTTVSFEEGSDVQRLLLLRITKKGERVHNNLLICCLEVWEREADTGLIIPEVRLPDFP